MLSHLDAFIAGDEGPPSVKYLSSSRLLKLQLRDASFRRHFLLQVLIFLHSVRVLGKGQAAPKDALRPKQVCGAVP